MAENRKSSANILLGVTGSIAAYKSAEVVRLLKKRGLDVKVLLTENGARFIGAETLATLSGHPVYTKMFAASRSEQISHISLSDWANVLLVAPATANVIAKFAGGLADDLLSTTFISCDCPVLIAPAMNSRMYAHPVVQKNIERLRQFGASFIGPEPGELACGTSGKGRMSDPETIVDVAASVARFGYDLKGLKVLVSAGPTREMIDPIRFISNRSSGKMGFALARAAAARGAKVTLVAGPTTLEPPHGIDVRNVISAEEMRKAVLDALPGQDAVIMAAAVADYAPRAPARQKLKKGPEGVSLELARTPDVLAEVSQVRRKGQVVVGFAAETEEVVENARAKLFEKNLDFIIANDVSLRDSGLETDVNTATLLWPDGKLRSLEPMAKTELAHIILSEVLVLLKPPPS